MAGQHSASSACVGASMLCQWHWSAEEGGSGEVGMLGQACHVTGIGVLRTVGAVRWDMTEPGLSYEPKQRAEQAVVERQTRQITRSLTATRPTISPE